MTAPANIRYSVPVPFPALVTGSGPIGINKTNGIWTVSYNVAPLNQSSPPFTDTTHSFLTYWNSTTNSYAKVAFSDLLSTVGAGLPGGSNGQVQWNAGGLMGGISRSYWDNTQGTLTLMSGGLPPPAASSITLAGAPTFLQVQSTSGYSFGGLCFGNTGFGIGVALAKSRAAAPGSHVILQNNDFLGGMDYWGDNGGAYQVGASIGAAVDAAPAFGVMPGRITFSTGTTTGGQGEAARIDSNQNITTGGYPNTPFQGLISNIQSVVAAPGSVFNFSGIALGANVASPGIAFAKTRGTVPTAQTIVAANDFLGSIDVFGSDGANYQYGGALTAQVDGTPAAGSMPTRWRFTTSPPGSTTPVERMRLDSKGNVTIGAAAVATTATDGFLYIPTCSGVPTGVPTTYSGLAPVVYDATHNALYTYNAGWNAATGGGGGSGITGGVAHGIAITNAATTIASNVLLPVNNFLVGQAGSDPIANTPAQVTALLGVFSSALQGMAPPSGGGATNFLRADGTWAVPPAGGSGITGGTIHGVAVTNAATTIASSIVLPANNFLVGQAAADPIAQTPAQVATILPTFSPSTTAPGVVPGANGATTSNFLRADGTWAVPPAGGSGISSGVAHGVAITNAATTIASNVVLGANNFLVGQAGADPIANTPAQVTALLGVFTSSLQGMAPPSGGGTANFLRADGSWVAPPTGGGGSPPGGLSGQAQWNNAGAFAGIANLTTNGTNILTARLGSTSTLDWDNGSGTVDVSLKRTAASQLSLTTTNLEALRIDSSQNLTTGGFANTSILGQPTALQVNSVAANAFTIGATALGNSSSAASLMFAKTRGTTPSTQTIVQSGDILMEHFAMGSDGVAYQMAAAIEAIVDGAPAANSMPGRLSFWTTPNLSTAPKEAMRIDRGQLATLMGDVPVAANIANNILEVHGSSTPGGIAAMGYSNNAGALGINSYKSRNGTPGLNTIVQSGDTLGQHIFYGDNGTGFSIGARIDALVDAAPGATSMPGRIAFSTTPSGTTTAVEALRVDNGQRIVTGGYPTTALFGLNSQIESVITVGSTGAANGANFSGIGCGNVSGAPGMFFGKTRGTTPTTQVAVQNNDALYALTVGASDGAAYQTAASMVAYADATPVSGNVPGRLVLQTCPVGGGGALVARQTIYSDGSTLFSYPGGSPIARESSGMFAGMYIFDAGNSSVTTSPPLINMTIPSTATGGSILSGGRKGDANSFMQHWFNSGNPGLGFGGGVNLVDIWYSRRAAGVAGFGTTVGAADGWMQWGGQTRVTSNFSMVTTTVLNTVTGLSVNVQAGRTYSFQAELSCTWAAANGIQVSVSGTCTATSIVYDGWVVDSGANGIKGNAQATALNTAVANTALTGTAGHVTVSGTITVNAAGTLTIRAAQAVSGTTATVVLQGSRFMVWDMP